MPANPQPVTIAGQQEQLPTAADMPAHPKPQAAEAQVDHRQPAQVAAALLEWMGEQVQQPGLQPPAGDAAAAIAEAGCVGDALQQVELKELYAMAGLMTNEDWEELARDPAYWKGI
jgi:hypothetical protein